MVWELILRYFCIFLKFGFFHFSLWDVFHCFEIILCSKTSHGPSTAPTGAPRFPREPHGNPTAPTGRTDERPSGRTDGTDGQADGRTDGRTDGRRPRAPQSAPRAAAELPRASQESPRAPQSFPGALPEPPSLPHFYLPAYLGPEPAGRAVWERFSPSRSPSYYHNCELEAPF